MDILEMEGKEAVEQVILKEDVRKLYEAYEQNLKDTEKTVIRLRYGLFGSKEHTQREIAGQLGISRSYVSRLEEKGGGETARGIPKGWVYGVGKTYSAVNRASFSSRSLERSSWSEIWSA